MMAEQVTTDRLHAQNRFNGVSVVSQNCIGIDDFEISLVGGRQVMPT